MAPHTLWPKASGDFGGGGGGPINARSPMKMTYDAIKVISLNKDFSFKIIKDKNKGKKGSVDTQDAIKMMADMIAANALNGSMDLFQETMSMKIVEKINEVLDGDIIPKGDGNENTVQRKSRGNGTRHNSLLQRFIQLRRSA
jgi:hypothetical protein